MHEGFAQEDVVIQCTQRMLVVRASLQSDMQGCPVPVVFFDIVMLELSLIARHILDLLITIKMVVESWSPTVR